MMAGNETASGGIGFFGLLGIVFITLKLCGVINWSWWFVLMPIYVVPACLLFVIVCALCFALLAALGEKQR